MPKIHPYESQQQSPSPVSIQSDPNDFGASAYEGAKNLGAGLEDTGAFLEKRATQSEISDTNAKLSDLRAKFTQNLSEGLKTADPGDKEFTQRYIDEYDKQASQIQNGIQTPGAQNFFERSNEHLRTSLLTSAVSGQTELAGAKASQDVLTSINNNSNAIMASPPSWESAKQQFAAGLEAQVQTGGLSREASLKLQSHANQEFAKAAIEGWAQSNPDYAKKLLQSNKFDNDIDSDTKEQMFGRITQAQHAQLADQALRQKLKDAATEAGQEKTRMFYQEGIFNGSITTKDIVFGNKLPDGGVRLDAAQTHTWMNYAESQAHTAPGFKDHSPAFTALHDRFFLPDGNPNKIVSSDQMVPYATNQRDADGNITKPATLSPEDFQTLNTILMAKKTQNGNDEAEQRKGLLDEAKVFSKKNPMTGEVDPQGLELTRKAQLLMIQKWDDGRKAGIPWTDLVDRDNPNYVGKVMKSPAFQRSAMDIMNDNMSYMFPQKGQVQATPSPTPPANDQVRVQNPNGATGVIPRSQLEDAKKAGYKEVK